MRRKGRTCLGTCDVHPQCLSSPLCHPLLFIELNLSFIQTQAQGRGYHTTSQNTLTKFAGPRLVIYQAHGDVPARRSANCGVAGLLASQRVPGEVGI